MAEGRAVRMVNYEKQLDDYNGGSAGYRNRDTCNSIPTSPKDGRVGADDNNIDHTQGNNARNVNGDAKN